jgi:aspartyl-tRNA(Asn)/glutamyl-tRNA(Gln) amidotransferase subunit B
VVNQETLDQYRPTIGIECHVQLKTKTKLFSGADNNAREAAPNTMTSPLCFGFPGTLPVLNWEAVRLAVRAGKAMNAQIAEYSRFDRKHYFYPDLPKGYQITQLEFPTVGPGWIEILVDGTQRKIRITRAHIEEDAGKLSHPEGADYSLVDLNRAGTPLIEIVSEPDMHSAAEAKAYAQELYLLMKYADVTEGDLYHGNMRFDINVSVAKKDDPTLGKRAEVKNLNSFKSVERAAEYEFRRQVELLENGESIVQETRGWHDAKQKTFSQRSKENAHDYRYFPDADLPPITLSSDAIADMAKDLPALPPEIRNKVQQYDIAAETAETLLLADAQAALPTGRQYIKTIIAVGDKQPKAAVFAAHFLVNRDIRYRQDHPDEAATSIPTAPEFGWVYELLKEGSLSSNTADQLLFALRGKAYADKESLKAFAEAQGLLQENNTEALQQFVDEVLQDPANAKAVADLQAGQVKVMGYLVGQIMKRSKGKANPGLAKQLLEVRFK